jgi:ribosomal protein S18 acetylase RimI-like enzyme
VTRDTLSIRAFETRDEKQVRRLWLQAFPDDPPRNEPALVVRRKLEVQRELFLIGESGGLILATLLAGYDGFRCWVYHVAVDRAHRRKGYGQQMMRAAESLLRDTGYGLYRRRSHKHGEAPFAGVTIGIGPAETTKYNLEGVGI